MKSTFDRFYPTSYVDKYHLDKPSDVTNCVQIESAYASFLAITRHPSLAALKEAPRSESIFGICSIHKGHLAFHHHYAPNINFLTMSDNYPDQISYNLGCQK